MIKAAGKKKSNASEWEGELFYYTSILAGTPGFAFSGRGTFESPNKTGHHCPIFSMWVHRSNPGQHRLKGDARLNPKLLFHGPGSMGAGRDGGGLPRRLSAVCPCVRPAAASAVVPIPGTFSWPLAARGKPRRGMLRRAVFSDVQRKALEKMFQKQKYISKPDRKKLAAKLGLKDSQVRGAAGRGGQKVCEDPPLAGGSLREAGEKGMGAGRWEKGMGRDGKGAGSWEKGMGRDGKGEGDGSRENSQSTLVTAPYRQSTEQKMSPFPGG